jgi:hypothetical protein
MYIDFGWGKLKERYIWEDLGIDKERIILKWILKK